MPSKTPKQARTMAAAAHNREFARKVGIPQSVAKDFNQADAGPGILSKSPKHKHPGALGEAMRKQHHRTRMDYVRSHKGK